MVGRTQLCIGRLYTPISLRPRRDERSNTFEGGLRLLQFAVRGVLNNATKLSATVESLTSRPKHPTYRITTGRSRWLPQEVMQRPYINRLVRPSLNERLNVACESFVFSRVGVAEVHY